MLRDPVCGQRVRRDRAHARVEYRRVMYYLCCPRCQAEFAAAPERYARPELGEKVDRRISRQEGTR
jgi:YHS domain-containing protein